MERLVIVGPGRLGLALGQALWDLGEVERLTYFGRNPESPDHPLFHRGAAEYVYGIRRPEPDTTALILSLPDDEIPEMAWAIGGQGPPHAPIPALHTSLALSGEALAPLHAQGYTVGTLHPLVRLDRSLAAADRLVGAPILVSGERGAAAAAQRIVRSIGGRVLEIPVTRRPLAAGAAGLIREATSAQLRIGRHLFRDAGLSEDEAFAAAAALVRSIAEAATASESPAGLDRGGEDVELHLRALPPEVGEIYQQLARLGQIMDGEV